MYRNFKPDKHQRIREHHENKQPQARPSQEIYAKTLFKPRHDDVIQDWQINLRDKLDINKLETVLQEITGVDLEITVSCWLDVHIKEEGITWGDAIKCTSETFKELTQ
jgi:hypothetical protein